MVGGRWGGGVGWGGVGGHRLCIVKYRCTVKWNATITNYHTMDGLRVKRRNTRITMVSVCIFLKKIM